MSSFGKLNFSDLGKGLVVAVLGAVFSVLAQGLNAPGFDFATFDWGEVLKLAISTAFAYLVKNVLSDENGKVFGKIG